MPDRARGAPARATRRHKRSLTNVGGPVARTGEPALAKVLAHALDVRPGEADRWTHGFHTYPARMHPDTAARLAAAFGAPGCTVLDPFCGSGTVLVEAMARGYRAVGRDLNPLAVRLAGLRASVVPASMRRALRDRAQAIAGVAIERSRSRRALPHQGPVDRGFFERPTFVELAWLRCSVAAERVPWLREALLLVLSSLLVKLSTRASETDPRRSRVRRPPGEACRMFAWKAEELARRLGALAAAVPPGTPLPDIRADDARRLRTVGESSADLAITSPPYPNVYDYADQHALRFEWLETDDGPIRAGEIGARRGFADPRRGIEAWERDGAAWVAALARALRPGARACVLVGDGATRLAAVRSDECVRRWAAAAGLDVPASVSQARPAFDPETRRAFRDGARREHLLLLRSAGR